MELHLGAMCMHPNYHLSSLMMALSLGISSLSMAAEPLLTQHISVMKLKQKFQFSAFETKQPNPLVNNLMLVKAHKDVNKVSHVRMQQQYLGVPVFGGYVILHGKNINSPSALNLKNVRMTGVLYDGLAADLGALPAEFLTNTPRILQQFEKNYVNQKISEEHVVPMVYIDEQHIAHWAYKVSILVNYPDKIPERPTAIIEMNTGVSLIDWNDIKTKMIAVNGVGFGGNRKTGEYKYGKELPFLEITRNTNLELCFMENKHVKVIDMLHKYNSRNAAMKFSCKVSKDDKNKSKISFLTGYSEDGYDKQNGAFSPINDALYAGQVIKHMYHDWYGLEVLTKTDGSPMKLVMRVHYGTAYENAYWDGRQMTFGDGDRVMYPLVSVGVTSHEVSHGFTEQQSGLEYFGQSGGINESFSDMAAQAAEFYSYGTSSWKIGSEIMKEDSGYDALRYMDKPSLDGVSIDTAEDYYGGLDVHYSSGVYNRLFYILSNQPTWTVRKAFDVMVKANMDYWTPYATFEDAACGVLNAAEDLQYPVQDIKQALEDVMINYQPCLLENTLFEPLA